MARYMAAMTAPAHPPLLRAPPFPWADASVSVAAAAADMLADLAALFAAGLLVAWAGFAWFQKTRQGFADVL